MLKDFDEGFSKNKLLNFWKRRWYRTLPAYYFTIVIIIFISYLTSKSIPIVALLKTLFFSQNIYYYNNLFFRESWSLSIEEWFYLAIPIILYIFYRIFRINVKSSVLITSFIIILFSVFIRFYISSKTEIKAINEWNESIRSVVITRMDSLMIGVLLAWLFIYKLTLFKKFKNVMFLIGLVVFVTNKLLLNLGIISYENLYMQVVYFTLIPLSIGLMIPYLYYLKLDENNIIVKIITKISIISYSLYLINLTIISILILEPLKIHYWFKFILFWVLTLSLSILMYKFIEMPFMKLRDKK